MRTSFIRSLTASVLPMMGCSLIIFACCQSMALAAENKSDALKSKSSVKSRTAKNKNMQLFSPVLREGNMVPREYTVDGADISPPLQWTAVPANTQSLSIVVDDPDAPGGIWYHWIIFNIPPESPGLSNNVPKTGILPNGAQQGTNDFGKVGYNGPAPPHGAVHRYRFRLLALDTKLDLPAGVKKEVFSKAIVEHVLDQGQITLIYRH